MADTNNVSITSGTGAVSFNTGSTAYLGLTEAQVEAIISDIVIANTGSGYDLYSGKDGNTIFNFRTITAGSGILIKQTDDYLEIVNTGVIEAGSSLATVATTGSYNDLINKPSLVTSLSGLTDVNINSAESGQIMVYNNGKWTNEDLSLSGVISSVKSEGGGVDIWDSYNTDSTLVLRSITAGDNISISVVNNAIVISSDLTGVNTWLSGAGAPTTSDGSVGDYYLNSTNGYVYQKESSGWVYLTNITGPAGSTGTTGPQGLRGSIWSYGTTAPSSTANLYDMYLNTTNGYVYQYLSTGWVNIANISGPTGSQGIQGPSGTDGTDGTRGSIWTTGTSIPTSTTSLVDDMYLNTTNGYVYQYLSTGWSQVATIMGPQGQAGENGTAGTRGSVWSLGSTVPTSTTANSGDMYLDTSTYEIYQYSSSGWVDTNVNIKGQTGATGEKGATGDQGPVGESGSSMINKGTWVSGTTYSENDYVFYTSSEDSSTESMYIYNGTGTLVSTIAPNSDTTNWVEICGTVGPRGATWTTGSGTPISTTAKSGDLYLNLINGEVFTYSGTTWVDTNNSLRGPAGSTGPAGPSGTNITVGNGIPTSSTSQIGDSYLDLDSGEIYEFTSTGWEDTNFSVKGTSGKNGTIWTSGTVIPTGSGNSGDFYLNTSNGEIYQYNGSSWVQIENITGPTGPQGPIGAQGEKGNDGTGLTYKGSWVSGTSYVSGDYVFDSTSSTDTTMNMWVCESATAFTSTTHPYEDSSNWVEFTAPSGARGSQWTVGSGIPSSAAEIYDMYMNTSNGDVYQYQSTGWVKVSTIVGAKGDSGSTGTRGSLWTTGDNSTTPTSALIYDQYLDTTSGDVYQYNGSSWGVQGNIKGPAGSSGTKWINGTSDPSSSTTGMNIGDYYLNTTSGDIFQYETNGSTFSWVKIGNIQGPSGTLEAGFATYDTTTSTLTFTCSKIIMGDSLPTTDPANAGQLWNNNGVVCISLG